MSGIKINSADHWFSRCVREAAEWKCERCGAQYPEGSRALNNSHFYGRGLWETRYDILDCSCICYGCHTWFHAHPKEHTVWMENKLGAELFQVLVEHARDTMRGKSNRREVKEIALHYKGQYEWLLQQRARGVTGRLEFTGW